MPASAGTYTIAPEALAALEAVPSSGTSFGSIAIEAQGPPAYFTAAAASGGPIDAGALATDLGVGKNVIIK